MPYQFHEPLFARIKELGMIGFSTAYDEEAVELLEDLGTPAYKIASFELAHFPLLRERQKLPLEILIYILKNILKNHDILKSRSLETILAIISIWRKGNAVFR